MSVTTKQIQVHRYGVPLFSTETSNGPAFTEISNRFPSEDGFEVVVTTTTTTSVTTNEQGHEAEGYQEGFHIKDGVYGARGGENIAGFSGRCIALARNLGESIAVEFNGHTFGVHPSDNSAYDVADRYMNMTHAKYHQKDET